MLSGTVLCLITTLTACEGTSKFFSTSWGSGLEREQERLIPKITAGNAQKLATDSAGDKKQAKRVAEKIQDALSKTNNPAEQAVLVNAGLTAANNASDLIMVILGNLTAFLEPPVTTEKILKKIQTAGDVQTNAGIISGLLDAGNVVNNTALTGASPDNLALAAVTMLLADAQAENYMDVEGQKKYLEKFLQKRQQHESLLTDKQQKALILAQAAVQKASLLTDILKVLHLS
jgi:hypothetical protein